MRGLTYEAGKEWRPDRSAAAVGASPDIVGGVGHTVKDEGLDPSGLIPGFLLVDHDLVPVREGDREVPVGNREGHIRPRRAGLETVDIAIAPKPGRDPDIAMCHWFIDNIVRQARERDIVASVELVGDSPVELLLSSRSVALRPSGGD